MRRDTPAEPWLSFLNDLDAEIAGVTELHCIGGFAVVQAYGLARATADIDVLAVVPGSSSSALTDLAGKGSQLHSKHGVHLDFVTVATAPADYASRLITLYPSHWMRLFALEAHDLALTKLERNFERDRSDVEHLARRGYLKASVLRQRYVDELRSYVIGRESWQDQTLDLWCAATDRAQPCGHRADDAGDAAESECRTDRSGAHPKQERNEGDPDEEVPRAARKAEPAKDSRCSCRCHREEQGPYRRASWFVPLPVCR